MLHIYLFYIICIGVNKCVLIQGIINIKKEYEILLGELQKYNPELLDKDRMLAVSKSDMLDEEVKEELKSELPEDIDCLFISSVAQQGLMELKDKLWEMLNN